MRIDIQFGHMERSESLEAYAQDKFVGIVEEFLNRDDSHVQLWLVTEKSRLERGAPEFRCEASVRFPPRKEIFVSKSSDDMHDSINMAAKALEKQLRAHSKKEIKRAHTAPRAPELAPTASDL